MTWHFEREDDINEMLDRMPSASNIGIKGGDVAYYKFKKGELTTAAQIIVDGLANDVCFTVNRAVLKLSDGNLLDYEPILDAVYEEKLRRGIREHWSYWTMPKNEAIFYKVDATAEEVAKFVGYPTNETEIAKYLGLENKTNLKIKLGPEDKDWCPDVKIASVDANGKFIIKTHTVNKYLVCEYAPYRVRAEWDQIDDPAEVENLEVWWYPLKDTLDEWYYNEYVSYQHKIELEEHPSSDVLSAGTVAYNNAMAQKIKDSISEKGYYEYCNTFHSKERIWVEHFLPAEYGIVAGKNWIIYADDNLVEMAKKLGYDKIETTDNLVTKYGIVFDKWYNDIHWSTIANVSRSGVNITRIRAKDIFAANAKNKFWQITQWKYSAAKEGILANIKKYSIDPYEVSKLTTVWHYYVFAKALKKSLELPDDFSLRKTELSFLADIPEPRELKRNIIRALKDYRYTEDEFLAELNSIKAVAEKLGIYCRDVDACYKAAVDYVKSKR